jgi:hypothetical protein
MLLQEIYKGACYLQCAWNSLVLAWCVYPMLFGGVVDSMHQALVLQLMVLTPEDVGKVRTVPCWCYA